MPNAVELTGTTFRTRNTSGLFSRLAWVVVIGFLTLHLAGYFIYGHERMLSSARTHAASLAEQAYVLDQLSQNNPEILGQFSSDTLQIVRVAYPVALPQDRWPHSDEVIEVVTQKLKSLGYGGGIEQVGLVYVGGMQARFELTFPSLAGGYIHVVSQSLIGRTGYGSPAGFTMTFLGLLVAALVLFITKRHTRQLGRLADAAVRLGQGQNVPTLAEHIGSKELRRASGAFNSMRNRIEHLLEQRSAMLAGVSHDLRTLTTRLGLRLEAIPDVEVRGRAATDIQLMTNILDQALTYSKVEHSQEKFEQVDVRSVLMSVVDDWGDHDVKYEEVLDAQPSNDESKMVDLVVSAQFTSIHRLFNNLIDNAIKYGGGAQVRLVSNGVEIIDPGSGFDRSQTQTVLEPYARLEQARSQQTPGSGLGLSIAQSICDKHGWTLSFAQHPQGFCASVRFA